MSADLLLLKLNRVRKTGRDRWVAECPCHDSKSRASLAVRELPDGRVLMHDFGGCSTEEILEAIGLDVGVLFAEPWHEHSSKPVRRAFFAGDALTCLAFDAIFLGVVANDLSRGEPICESDRKRLWETAGRIGDAQELCCG